MSSVIIDAFNRVAADLTTSPSGRWAAPTGGGGANAWLADGQYAKTASTFAASSRGQLRWTGFDPGVDYGEVRCRFQRATTNVQEIGIFARSHRINMSDHRRLAIVWNSILTQWELRWYSTYTAYQLINSVTDFLSGFSMGTTWHDLKLRFVPINCQQTANTAACTLPASTLWVTCYVDSIFLMGASWPDLFIIPGPLNSYRGFGCEVLSNAAWRVPVGSPPVTPDDFGAFDNAEFDNLITANSETAPTLVSEPALTPITVTTEGTAVSSLPFTPDIGEEITKRWFTVGMEAEAPYVVTWARFQSGRRLFSIGHSALTKAEQVTLEAFLDSHKGSETPFTYVTDQGASVKAYFVEGSQETFPFTRYGVDNVRISYVIEELF